MVTIRKNCFIVYINETDYNTTILFHFQALQTTNDSIITMVDINYMTTVYHVVNPALVLHGYH